MDIDQTLDIQYEPLVGLDTPAFAFKGDMCATPISTKISCPGSFMALLRELTLFSQTLDRGLSLMSLLTIS